MLYLRPHRRLRAVLRPLHFVNTILVAVAPMGAVPSLRRALPDHFRLSAIRLIAPHSRFFAVQQIGQYRRIGYVGRRRHRRVDDLRLAIYSHVRLHPEVPFFSPRKRSFTNPNFSFIESERLPRPSRTLTTSKTRAYSEFP